MDLFNYESKIRDSDCKNLTKIANLELSRSDKRLTQFQFKSRIYHLIFYLRGHTLLLDPIQV